jgi:hypothetical protein
LSSLMRNCRPGLTLCTWRGHFRLPRTSGSASPSPVRTEWRWLFKWEMSMPAGQIRENLRVRELRGAPCCS